VQRLPSRNEEGLYKDGEQRGNCEREADGALTRVDHAFTGDSLSQGEGGSGGTNHPSHWGGVLKKNLDRRRTIPLNIGEKAGVEKGCGLGEAFRPGRSI